MGIEDETNVHCCRSGARAILTDPFIETTLLIAIFASCFTLALDTPSMIRSQSSRNS